MLFAVSKIKGKKEDKIEILFENYEHHIYIAKNKNHAKF